MTDNWVYQGDVNIEYGGLYLDLDPATIADGYANAIEVTDLTNYGQDGLNVVIQGSIYLWNWDKQRINNALNCIGQTTKDLRGKGKQANLLTLGYALYTYWGINSDVPETILVTQDYNGDKQSWQGTTPDIQESVRLAKQFNHNLRAYVEALQ